MKKSKFKILIFCLVISTMLTIITSSVSAESIIDLGLQDVTGYGDYLTGSYADGDKDGSPYDKPASGVSYQLGQCAVHPLYSNKNSPVLPYGTIIYIDQSKISEENTYGDAIPLPNNTWRASFVIQDLGDVDYAYHPNSNWWIDVYCGRWNEYGSKFSNEAAFRTWINSNIGNSKRYLYFTL